MEKKPMISVRAAMTRWMRDESGATAVEYGLIVTLVGIAVMTSFHSLGQTLAGLFGDIADAIERVNYRIR